MLFSMSWSAFLGYMPMTSGVIAAAMRIGSVSVSSSIFMTASRRMDADEGSM